MEYFPIKNYEEFKELFGSKEARRNKILLAQWCNKEFFKRFMSNKSSSFRETNIEWVTREMLAHLSLNCFDYIDKQHGLNKIELCNMYWYTPVAKLDMYKGICVDGDTNAIRYINTDTGKTYKMKASKFLQEKVLNYMDIPFLSEQLKVFMLEKFSTRWKLYANDKVGFETTLVVDDNFDKIYDSYYYSGDFGSCMRDTGFGKFYVHCNAKAASLWRKDCVGNSGGMIARCVIFNEVHLVDEPDTTYRLAERQYSENGDNVLKHMLINKLIEGGYIDGYKQIDAGCHDPDAFVLNDGTPMSYDTYIEINVDTIRGMDVPYMDSFKWYNESSGVAYNSSLYSYDSELETTDGSSGLEEEYYDSWHGVYTTDEVVDVYYEGVEYTCSENRLEDFVFVDKHNAYYHVDEVSVCPYCGEYYLSEDGYPLDCDGETYCSVRCRNKGLEEFHENNDTYDTFDDKKTNFITYKVIIDYDQHFVTVNNMLDLMSRNDIKIPDITINLLRDSDESFFKVNKILELYTNDSRFAL